MTTGEMAKAIAWAAFHARYNASMAGDVPAARAVLERMRAPRTGDLVVETSSIGWRRGEEHAQAVGVLKSRGRELAYITEDGVEVLDDYWHIVDLNGEPQRWRNCEFTAVPDGARFEEG